MTGKCGNLGVFQPEACPGDYRVKRGAKSSTLMDTSTKYKDDEMLKEDFRAASARGSVKKGPR